MKAGVLRKFLENLPENMEVLTPGQDHSYNRVHWAGLADVHLSRDGFSEPSEDSKLDAEDGGRIVEALLIT